MRIMNRTFSSVVRSGLSGATLALVMGTATEAVAEVCIKASNKVVNGKVVTSLSKVERNGKCKKGEIAALTGPQGPTGPKGATGAEGADGQLRIYGDGSGLAKTVSSSELFSDPFAMYTDVVIDSGATLTVPSGTVIRCTGSFVNNGTIVVQPGTPGGLADSDTTSTIRPLIHPAHPGVSGRSPSSGESGDSTNSRSGGKGGVGLTQFQASLLRYPGSFAGGAGAGGFFVGGAGGGSLVVLCAGAITNNGRIRADGGAGTGNQISGGGGGGGVIILASKTSVVSSASSQLLARGGNGANSGSFTGPSGGGGGGIVHLIAPSVNATGATVSVAAGSAGAVSTAEIDLTLRSGGHGGGASGGNGGQGGLVPVSSKQGQIAFDGEPGEIIYTIADPTSLF
jgi:hypothetical protein